MPPTTPTFLSARRKAYVHLLPLLFLCYAIAYVDRTNVAFAKLTMGKDLAGFDDAVFGFGAGVFFIGYFLLEVPGSVIVERWSARKWICRIMITWGLVAGATAFVKTPWQFYSMRFLLGLSEAGFFPGVIVYLGHWFTEKDRAKALAWFLIASPCAQLLTPRLSASILSINDSTTGLHGWQLLYLFWGLPAVALGLWVLFRLPDHPKDAPWLKADERTSLQTVLAAEKAARATRSKASLKEGLGHPRVLGLCVVFFAIVTANYGIEFFLPSVLNAWYGLSFGNLAWLVALPSLAVIGGQLLVGWSSDRFRERQWHVVVPVILASLALLAVGATRGHLALTVACFVVASAGLKAYLPAFLAIPSLFLTSTAAAASIGLINSIGNLGGYVGPAIMGWVQATTGSYEKGLLCLGVSCGVSAVCFGLFRLGRRLENPQAALGGSALPGRAGPEAGK